MVDWFEIRQVFQNTILKRIWTSARWTCVARVPRDKYTAFIKKKKSLNFVTYTFVISKTIYPKKIILYQTTKSVVVELVLHGLWDGLWQTNGSDHCYGKNSHFYRSKPIILSVNKFWNIKSCGYTLGLKLHRTSHKN